jgi:hypothetical protein
MGKLALSVLLFLSGALLIEAGKLIETGTVSLGVEQATCFTSGYVAGSKQNRPPACTLTRTGTRGAGST